MPVEVVHWNPRRPLSSHPLARALPIRRPVDNFGDLLGPRIVARIVQERGLREPQAERRLLAVGSILRLAADGDVLWGIGANGKSVHLGLDARRLDVRAVRGPRTRAVLVEQGFDVPEVYGDPGLLLGTLWSRDALAAARPDRAHVVIPNLHDLPSLRRRDDVVDPRAPLDQVLAAIASARMVVGSSLHAIVVAESLGIPARFVASAHEPAFKYLDYLEGTGRDRFDAAADPDEALRMGGQPAPSWDPAPLLAAFPDDLWASADAAAADGGSQRS